MKYKQYPEVRKAFKIRDGVLESRVGIKLQKACISGQHEGLPSNSKLFFKNTAHHSNRLKFKPIYRAVDPGPHAKLKKLKSTKISRLLSTGY
jgi:hypothetical protein